MGEKRGGCLGGLFKLGLAFFLLCGLLVVLSSKSEKLPEPAPIVDKKAAIEEASIRAKKQAAESIAEEIQIPNLKASDVYTIATEQGFKLETYPADSPHEWTTSKESDYGILQLDCHGRNESDIYAISLIGGAAPGWEKELNADVATFFPDAVGKLKIDGVDSKAAAEWVAKNLGTEASETFGPCEFTLLKGTGFGLNIRMKH